jgi:hypothetical protein
MSSVRLYVDEDAAETAVVAALRARSIDLLTTLDQRGQDSLFLCHYVRVTRPCHAAHTRRGGWGRAAAVFVRRLAGASAADRPQRSGQQIDWVAGVERSEPPARWRTLGTGGGLPLVSIPKWKTLGRQSDPSHPAAQPPVTRQCLPESATLHSSRFCSSRSSRLAPRRGGWGRAG